MSLDDVYRQNKPLMTPGDLEIQMAGEEAMQAHWRALPSSLLWDKTKTRPWLASSEVYPVFCISCGAPQGYVTRDAMEHGVVFLCRPCATTHGGLPLPEVPEDLVRPRRV